MAKPNTNQESNMTRVTSRQMEVTRYEWTVPCDTLDGRHMCAVYGEVQDAVAMAASQAKGFGINTTSDDWLRVSPRDDEIVFYFDVQKPKTRAVTDVPNMLGGISVTAKGGAGGAGGYFGGAGQHGAAVGPGGSGGRGGLPSESGIMYGLDERTRDDPERPGAGPGFGPEPL